MAMHCSTIPTRIKFARNDDTIEDAAKWLHDALTRAEPYQHTPLRQIVSSWRRNANDKLFDILFVFQRVNESSPNEQDQLWQPWAVDDDLYDPEVRPH